MGLFDRFRNGWNAFTNLNRVQEPRYSGSSYSYRPDAARLNSVNDKSIINSVYSRIAIDVADVSFEHARTDENGRFIETMNTGLNRCLTLSANIDQSSLNFFIDMVLNICSKGAIAICPIESTDDPENTSAYDINTMRVGEIITWKGQSVVVRLYDERTGEFYDVPFLKRSVAIVENPLRAVMNNPNSTMQRLIRKLNYLDAIDRQSSSGKLDLIIQLPYAVKTDTKREQARKRREDIEIQLTDSQYGIAYIDATERITQLNRPIENNLMGQIEYLTKMLYNQLGISEAVFDGTADEATMLNYQKQTIKPIARAIAEEMTRKFLSQKAIAQGQKIWYHNDPFALVPIGQIAEIADKFTRNEILTSNEMRGVLGYKPVLNDPKADALVNSNISMPEETMNQIWSNSPPRYPVKGHRRQYSDRGSVDKVTDEEKSQNES